MNELQTARIRLEGRLETIESVSRLLQASVSSESTRVAAWAEQQSPATLEAEASVRAMAKEAPRLESTLEALKAARESFERAVRERLGVLQVPETSIEVGLRALEAEPVRFFRHDRTILTARRTAALALPLLVCTLAAPSEPSKLFFAIVAAATIAVAMAEHLALMTLIVTSKRFITHVRSVSLTEIKAVRVQQPRWWDRDRRVQLEVELEYGSDTFRISEWPTKLLAAFRAAGVRVDP